MATPPTLFDLPTGERAKDAGQEQAGTAERAWPWRQHALQVIRDYAVTGVPFTADDVVLVCGLPDVGPNRNNAVGAVFTTAAKRGWIVKTGAYRKSRRTLAHARIQTVWCGNPDWEP